MADAPTSNAFPIILVHGFSGWGRNELVGVKYWGGIQGDIQEDLKKQGHTVYTAVVGPFSSNWDRACELYAQIKGGQVDYGATHSSAHGHARFGRAFPGLYPEWGEVGADGKVKKIHLMGHSMGGQTIRMLAQLMAKGSKGAPVEETVSTHPLFTGGKEDWVHSITTISTPNQGTLLADVFHSVSGLVTDALVAVFSSLNVLGDIGDDFYDAKLDQWGISPKGPHESLKQYMTRVFHSPLFAPGVKDMALWSLSTSGAAEESTWVETLPSIYYFSYATVDTHASHDRYHRNIHKANFFTMFFALQPLGNTLGGRLAPDRGFSEEWQANDGVVNSISMCNDAKGDYVVFTDLPKRGVWNGMPTLEPMDHIAVVGLTIHTNVLKKLYNAHAKLLRTLPITADEKVTVSLHKQQQLACGHIHEAVGELCEEAAAAEAAMRQKQLASSEQEPPEEESRITQVAWEADDTVKPIPVYEAEP